MFENFCLRFELVAELTEFVAIQDLGHIHLGGDGIGQALVVRAKANLGRLAFDPTIPLKHLSAGRFKSIEFPVPPIPEQEIIVANVEEKLSSVSHIISEVDNQLLKAASLRSAVLTSAFSGKMI